MSQTASAVAAGTNPGPPPVMQLGADSRNVPVYVLFLIMLSSGIVTLLILWGCIQYINHKRRFNNTAADGDIERNGMARGSLAEGHVGSRNEQPQHLLTASSQENGAQLTYVVMAGDEKPTFLALPSTKTFRADPSPQSTEMATMKIEKQTKPSSCMYNKRVRVRVRFVKRLGDVAEIMIHGMCIPPFPVAQSALLFAISPLGGEQGKSDHVQSISIKSAIFVST